MLYSEALVASGPASALASAPSSSSGAAAAAIAAAEVATTQAAAHQEQQTASHTCNSLIKYDYVFDSELVFKWFKH